MKDAFFPGLVLFLQFSLFVNIQFIKSYITTRKDENYNRLITITVFNLLLGMVILFIMMYSPDIVTKFRMQSMMVPESGLIFLLLVFIKTRIAIGIIKRSKDPEFFDISFFGKKVYKPGIVKKSEVAIYIFTMPFTLITGAYFLANVFV